MSNPKTAIDEIKNLMVKFGFMSDGPVFKSFKLEDNTILETLELKVGEKITKISDDFKRVPLRTGSYKLVENFKIEVKDGTIKSVKQIFVDAKLVDGTKIKVEGDGLVEGAKVLVVTEDGELPAPDGVHELSDGTKVETKEGLVVKIDEKVEAGSCEDMKEDKDKKEMGNKDKKDMEEVEVPVEVPAEVAPIAQEVVEAIVEALVPLMEEVKVLVEEMKKMKDGMKKMEGDFSDFKKEPASKKISDGKTDFNKQFQSETALDAKIAAITEMRKK